MPDPRRERKATAADQIAHTDDRRHGEGGEQDGGDGIGHSLFLPDESGFVIVA